VESVLEAAEKRNLDGLAITDHETVTTPTHASDANTGMIVIPGVEIETSEGHLLVLGVRNPPPSKRSFAETIDAARKAGGIVIVPHPGIPFISVSNKVIRQNKPDAIETHNDKAPLFRYFVKRNTRLADSLGLPKTGGSDAHSCDSVGDAYTIIDADSRSVEDILAAIRMGRTQPVGEASAPLLENVITTAIGFLRERVFKPRVE